MKARLRPADVGAVLAAATAALVLHAAAPAFPAPPADPTRLLPWTADHGAVAAVAGTLRVLAVAGCVWTVATTTVLAATEVLRLPLAVRRAVASVTPAAGRRLVRAAAAVTVAAGASTPQPALAAPTGPTASMRTTTTLTVGAPHDAPPILRRLPDDAAGTTTSTTAAPTTTTTVAPSPSPPATAPTPTPVTTPTPTTAQTPSPTWTVERGQHLWSIAEAVVAERTSAPPTDAAVDPYWRALVAANRDRLPDPSNPDLVFPGTTLVLPPAR